MPRSPRPGWLVGRLFAAQRCSQGGRGAARPGGGCAPREGPYSACGAAGGCGTCPPLPPPPSQASPLMELRPRSPPSPWLRAGGRPGLGYTWSSSGPGRGSVRGCTSKPAQDELKQPIWEVGFPWSSEGALRGPATRTLAPKSSGESGGRESPSQGRLS